MSRSGPAAIRKSTGQIDRYSQKGFSGEESGWSVPEDHFPQIAYLGGVCGGVQ